MRSPVGRSPLPSPPASSVIRRQPASTAIQYPAANLALQSPLASSASPPRSVRCLTAASRICRSSSAVGRSKNNLGISCVRPWAVGWTSRAKDTSWEPLSPMTCRSILFVAWENKQSTGPHTHESLPLTSHSLLFLCLFFSLSFSLHLLFLSRIPYTTT